jgi:hypothetical protein
MSSRISKNSRKKRESKSISQRGRARGRNIIGGGRGEVLRKRSNIALFFELS